MWVVTEKKMYFVALMIGLCCVLSVYSPAGRRRVVYENADSAQQEFIILTTSRVSEGEALTFTPMDDFAKPF